MVKVSNRAESLAFAKLTNLIRRARPPNPDEILQEAVAKALEAHPQATGSDLEVAAMDEAPKLIRDQMWEAKRERTRRATGDHSELIAQADPDVVASQCPPPSRPRAPDLPADTIRVVSADDSLSLLRQYIFAAPTTPEGLAWWVETPPCYNAWEARLESGDLSAADERPRLIKRLKVLHCIVHETSFESWRRRPEVAERRLSLRPTVLEWLKTDGAEEELYAALAKPWKLDLRKAEFARCAIDHTALAASSTVLAAHLLTERVIQPLVEGNPAPPEHQSAVLAAFESVFHVSPSNAWILPFLDQLAEARRERRNAELRSTTLTEGEQDRFNKQQPVPCLLDHAAAVLKRTREIVASWPGRRVSVPKWLDERLTAMYLERYGFAHGGGPKRKLSREGLRRLLSDPRLVLEDVSRIPDSRISTDEEEAVRDAMIAKLEDAVREGGRRSATSGPVEGEAAASEAAGPATNVSAEGEPDAV